MANEYTIQKGDTLAQIAKKNNATVDALLQLNPSIKNPNLIYAGQKLTLSGGGTSTQSASQNNAVSTVQKQESTGTAATTNTAAPQTNNTGSQNNTPLGYMQYTPLSDDELRQRAENYINPLYNEQIEAYKQAAERNKMAYEQAIQQRQNLYELQKEDLASLAGQQRKQASDQALKRGLARSNIATNEIARVSASEAKALQELQRGLTDDINNINAQITLLEQQLSDSLKRLDIDRATSLQAKIDELRREQEDKLFKVQQYNNQLKQYEEQFAYQKERDTIADQRWREQFDWQKYIDQEQLKLQKSRAGSGGSGGSGSGSGGRGDAYSAAYYELFSSKDPYSVLNTVLKKYSPYLTNSQIETLKAYVNAWKAQYGKQTVQKTSTAKSTTPSVKVAPVSSRTGGISAGGALGKQATTF